MYRAGGTSLDWSLGKLGIPYSFTMELRDTGTFNFLLPPHQIEESGQEVWAFHQSVAREMLRTNNTRFL